MMIFKLNNLCYNEEISEITDEYKAKKCVDGFVDLLHKLREAGILEQIESDIKINNINIGSNYHVYDWLNDSDVKREHIFLLMRNLMILEAKKESYKIYLILQKLNS